MTANTKIFFLADYILWYISGIHVYTLLCYPTSASIARNTVWLNTREKKRFFFSSFLIWFALSLQAVYLAVSYSCLRVWLCPSVLVTVCVRVCACVCVYVHSFHIHSAVHRSSCCCFPFNRIVAVKFYIQRCCVCTIWYISLFHITSLVLV